MKNWREIYPGFWLPNSWQHDPSRWTDYTDPSIEDRLEQLDELSDLVRLRGLGQPSRRAWGAWLGAFNNDKPLTRGWAELEQIADKQFDIARYRFLVPAWRRAITKVLTELDDVEDQLSTILWAAEWITRKVIPIPPTLMNRADQVRRSLDCAEKVLGGITPFRTGKSDYANCLKSQARARDAAKAQRTGLLAWFKENWGRLLEAAQATGQWFDVGIVLGPVMGWIEEGMWGLARKTTDNYLIAVDALAPGYRDDFIRNANELSQAVDQAWESTWGSVDNWTTEEISEIIELGL